MGSRSRSILMVAGAATACGLVLAASAAASEGIWERAWGKNVNGGGVFGVCTMAGSCMTGTAGGLGGEFAEPYTVATDAAGDVYVTDSANHRIQKFDSQGNWERAWGKGVNGGAGFEVCTVASSCVAGTSGTLGGEMNLPFGIATDAAGSVYVADLANHRIQKFDSLGNWERAWGKGVNGGGAFGVCTVATSCQAGTTGGLGGELSGPMGVATDAAGNVYVGDRGNERIQKFNSAGTWERAWGKNVNGGGVFGVCTAAASCLAGTEGGLGGELNDPVGVATDTAGNVYVADLFNQRIQKFSSAGTWERAWGKNVNSGGLFGVCINATSCEAGTTGTAGGEFSFAGGVTTDAGGKVYVADGNTNRIQKFDSLGNWERAWGRQVDAGVGYVCTVAASCQMGGQGGLGGELNNPSGVASDAAGVLYVGDPTANRIQKFALPSPVLTGTDPPSPANNNNPKVLGTAYLGSTVTLFDDANCTPPAAFTGPESIFTSPGFIATVPDNSTTTFSARATTPGDASSCSTTNVTYTEVTPPPTPPTPPQTTPTSTGRRAAALKKCKKKRGKARRKCIKRAKKLPV